MLYCRPQARWPEYENCCSRHDFDDTQGGQTQEIRGVNMKHAIIVAVTMTCLPRETLAAI